jgi:MATE family multidrug resistance protein
MVTFLRIGRLGKEELAAAALGSMLCNATAFAIGFGLSSALGPTCGQAFGAKNYSMVGRQCQRMMAILTLFCVPISLVWWHAAVVIRALGLPLAEVAQNYTRAMVWGMWPYFMFDCLRRYLAAQKLTWPITAASVATICTHVAVSDVMVARHGLSGAGWANAIANWTLLGLLSALIVAQRCCARRNQRADRSSASDGWNGVDGEGSSTVLLPRSQANTKLSSPFPTETLSRHPGGAAGAGGLLLLTWPSPFSRDVLQGWGQLLELGSPSAASLLIEWGGFELNATIAGHLGIEQLATHSVFAQYSALFYALPNGVAQAAATLGSNALGAGDAATAQQLVPLAYACCMVCGILQGGLALSNRSRMGALFSNDPHVIRMTSEAAPIFCVVYEIADVWKCAGMLYLRETGRPVVCAQAAAGSVLLFALPLSFCLAMLWGYGLGGVWLGSAAGWYLCGAMFVVVLWNTDWEKEARKAVATQRNKPGAPAPNATPRHNILSVTKPLPPPL